MELSQTCFHKRQRSIASSGIDPKTNILLPLVRSYESGTLYLSHHTNAEHFVGFRLQVFCQAGPPQRVDRLTQEEISVECLSQGRNDALPVRKSDQGSATFRLLDRRSASDATANPTFPIELLHSLLFS